MPHLALDLLRIAALLLMSTGLGAIAILLAARLHLDRFFRPAPSPSPNDTITHLADLADFARSGGLISIAAPAASLHIPLLSRGVNLLIEGHPTHKVRDILQSELDAHTLRASTSPAAATLGAVAILALGAAAVASAVIASTTSSTTPLILGATLLFPAAIALALSSKLRDHASAHAPQSLLRGMLAIEAVCLISARRDGAAVRNHLSSLLPQSAPAPITAAA